MALSGPDSEIHAGSFERRTVNMWVPWSEGSTCSLELHRQEKVGAFWQWLQFANLGKRNNLFSKMQAPSEWQPESIVSYGEKSSWQIKKCLQFWLYEDSWCLGKQDKEL